MLLPDMGTCALRVTVSHGTGRRVVDQKASKGRKLRFDIQPKLVNFMFPAPDHPPSFAESLFDNLFKAS